MDSGATISECKQYRYALWRVWNPEKPIAMFIGLNPSTADAHADDPTIRRCMRFAGRWGYGGIHMLNLFAFRATDPADMKKAIDPVGPLTDSLLLEWANRSGVVIFCWGCDGNLYQRDRKIIDLFPDAVCLGKTKDGFPKHPLYLASTTQLEPFIRQDNGSAKPKI